MGPFMAVVPLVISAAGAAASGMAASNAANYQAQVARQNAEFAKQKGEMLMQDYATKSMEKGMQDRATMGKLEASLASSGLDVESGSTKGVLAGEREITKMGSLDYAKAAGVDWWQTRRDQYSATAEATLDKAKAESAAYAGAAEASSSLIGGGVKLNKEYGWFSG
jgi:hypothetical protein